MPIPEIKCIEQSDPWLERIQNVSGSPSLEFDDSFTATGKIEQETGFKPLDDHEEYLAGLEKKLKKMHHKRNDKLDRRQVLSDLCSAKSDYMRRHLDDNTPREIETELDESVTLKAVDPQGAYGALLKKAVPDRVALSPEELCALLRADILQAQYEKTLPDNIEDPK